MVPRIYDVRPEDVAELSPEDLVQLLALLLGAEQAWFHVPRAIDVPDGGLDGLSWHTENLMAQPGCLLGVGKVGWQVKAARSMDLAAALKEPFAKKAKTPKPAVQALLKANGHYALACGRTLTSVQRENWEANILRALKGARKRWTGSVRVLDGTLLTEWVNRYPSVVMWVRARVRRPLPTTARLLEPEPHPGELEYEWTQELAEHRRDLLSHADVSGSVLRVCGPRQVGKTRFVVESLRHAFPGLGSIALLIDAAEDITVRSHLRQLIEHRMRVVLVVDECDENLHRVLAHDLARSDTTVRLITIGHRASEPGHPISLTPEKAKSDPIRVALDRRWKHGGKIDHLVEDAEGYIGVALELAEQWDGEGAIPLLSERTVWRFLEPERRTWGIDFHPLTLFAEILSVFGPLDLEESGEAADHVKLAERFQLSPQAWPRAHREFIRRDLLVRHDSWRSTSWKIKPRALARVLTTRFLEARTQRELATLLVDPTLPDALRYRLSRWIAEARERDRFEVVARDIVRGGDWRDRRARSLRLGLVHHMASSSPGAVRDLLALLLEPRSGNESLSGQEVETLLSSVLKAAPHDPPSGALLLFQLGIRLIASDPMPRRTRELTYAQLALDLATQIDVVDKTMNAHAECIPVGASILGTLMFRAAGRAAREPGPSSSHALEAGWHVFTQWWGREDAHLHLRDEAAQGFVEFALSDIREDVERWLLAERSRFGLWREALAAAMRRRSEHADTDRLKALVQLLWPRTLEERAVIWIRSDPMEMGWWGTRLQEEWSATMESIVVELLRRPVDDVVNWVLLEVKPDGPNAAHFGWLLAKHAAEALGPALFEAWTHRAPGRNTNILLGFIEQGRAQGRTAMLEAIDAVVKRDSSLNELRRNRELYLDKDMKRLEAELREAIPKGRSSREYHHLVMIPWTHGLPRQALEGLLEQLADLGDVGACVVLDILFWAHHSDRRKDALSFATELLQRAGVVEAWVADDTDGHSRLRFVAELVEQGELNLGMRVVALMADRTDSRYDLHEDTSFRKVVTFCMREAALGVLDTLFHAHVRHDYRFRPDLFRRALGADDSAGDSMLDSIASEQLDGWLGGDIAKIALLVDLLEAPVQATEPPSLARVIQLLLDRFGYRDDVREVIEDSLLNLSGNMYDVPARAKLRLEVMRSLEKHPQREVRQWARVVAERISAEQHAIVPARVPRAQFST